MGTWRRALLDRLPAPAAEALCLIAARVAECLSPFTNRRAGLALVYHGIGGRRTHGELVPTISSPLLEAHVRHLRDRYQLVTASELPRAVANRLRGRPFPVAITFDDDLPSHGALAMPILRKLDAPATFFICGASLERAHAFWWERLQSAADRGWSLAQVVAPGTATAVSPTKIEDVAELIETMPSDRREAVSDAVASLLGPDPPEAGMRASDVRGLAEEGFEIGFHTLRHDRLPALDDAALTRALLEGRGEIEAAAGRPLKAIAYPHGRADARVASAARQCGYQVGFTTSGRPTRPDDEPLLLGRLYPSLSSLGEFRLQLARAVLSARGLANS